MIAKVVRQTAAAIALVMTTMAAAPTAAQQKPQPEALPSEAEMRAMLERIGRGESEIQGDALDRLIEAAAVHPLGSLQNPVRAAMPPGQRAYLAKLRCRDGRAPAFQRVANVGVGIYGNIIDAYQVTCAGSTPVMIYMDMYHRGYEEHRPVPGFTIASGRPGSEA